MSLERLWNQNRQPRHTVMINVQVTKHCSAWSNILISSAAESLGCPFWLHILSNSYVCIWCYFFDIDDLQAYVSANKNIYYHKWNLEHKISLIVGIDKENYGFPNFHTSNNHLKTGFCWKYQLKCIHFALIML